MFKSLFSVFSICEKWLQNIIKKTNKYYKEEHMRTIKIFLKKKIYKKREYARNQYGKLFKENKFSEEEKNKNLQYARDICNNLSKEKKDKRHKNAREKCRNLSEEENDKKHQYARDCYRNIFKKL